MQCTGYWCWLWKPCSIVYKNLESVSRLLHYYRSYLQCTASIYTEHGLMALPYTICTHACSLTLYHPYNTRAVRNPAAASTFRKLFIVHTHIKKVYTTTLLQQSPRFALLAHPHLFLPLSLSGRKQWALSSAECDVMQIFAVTNPEGIVHVVQQA